jgi:CTP synthase
MPGYVIEFARNVCALAGAHSSEFNKATEYPVIDIMPEQVGVTQKGGTMRLGAYPCKISPGTLMCDLYAVDEISERHRHRFEVNNAYRGILTENGLCLCGTSPDGKLVEAVELPKDLHPFYIGVQFHPEFKSRPNKPHPLFLGLIRAALKENV